MHFKPYALLLWLKVFKCYADRGNVHLKMVFKLTSM